jgi:glucose-1-phosphate cytidylyltransferase
VTGIQHLSRSGLYVNGGYFIFRKEIFNYIRDGEELVEEPFRRLVEEGLLAGYRHDGFWMPMDTFKDKQLLEDMYAKGVAPWEVWKNGGHAGAHQRNGMPLTWDEDGPNDRVS